MKGFPHETLHEQHRMRPEISALVRQLTYPDLVNDPSTKSCPDIRGPSYSSTTTTRRTKILAQVPGTTLQPPGRVKSENDPILNGLDSFDLVKVD